jgi:thiol-disulfide isomerase/thioredoxin
MVTDRLRQSGGPRATLLVLTVLAALASGRFAPVVTAQAPADPYAAAMQKGQAAMRVSQWDAAIAAFKQANTLRDKKSAEALLALCRAYNGAAAAKSAVDTCTEGLKYAGEDALMNARLHNERGQAYFITGQTESATGKDLKSAEAEFRATLELTDTLPIASFNLGWTLLKQNRDAEGLHELQAYIERSPSGPEAAKARGFLANPRRAREDFSPDFSLTTLEGEYIALDDLKGKTVLLDFWGTWCGPCRAATPDLVRFYKSQQSRDKSFVMIGIAVDDKDEAKWKAYIADNRMQWAEYNDKNYKVATAFQVHTFPTYIVMDGEGIIHHGRKEGWGADTMGWITSTLDEAQRATKKAAGGLSPLLAPPRKP